jgi:hypothetical protein
MLVYMQSAWLLLCPNHNGLLTHLLALVSPQAACTVLPTWRQQCAQNQLPAGIACLCCQAYTIPHGTWHNPASVTADCALAVSPGGSSVRTMVCPLASAASAASAAAPTPCHLAQPSAMLSHLVAAVCALWSARLHLLPLLPLLQPLHHATWHNPLPCCLTWWQQRAHYGLPACICCLCCQHHCLAGLPRQLGRLQVGGHTHQAARQLLG